MARLRLLAACHGDVVVCSHDHRSLVFVCGIVEVLRQRHHSGLLCRATTAPFLQRALVALGDAIERSVAVCAVWPVCHHTRPIEARSVEGRREGLAFFALRADAHLCTRVVALSLRSVTRANGEHALSTL